MDEWVDKLEEKEWEGEREREAGKWPRLIATMNLSFNEEFLCFDASLMTLTAMFIHK